ncbi:xanthine dehydrogenase family protein subunit M [Desulfosporosinus sp.]|uniref:FAD binding domain-containing protein n=1 Tax=Desulfosporosinus sp. TaxID=157907 RepID=UPI00231D2C90|nr:xanthine dehydrogenase family protein subunit M [Desulfosporosinus sp.]MDA8222968.1 xanthine dehydrogenase family protein subunit M [Desulfitobacterium hafniense]
MKTNTKILAAEFEYLECHSLADALDAMTQYSGKAKILAGGTDLLTKMKSGLLQCEYLIFVKKIEGLNYLISDSNTLRIGPMVSLRTIEKSEQVKAYYSALFEAVRSMAATSVKNMATIGGNLCNGSPAADTAPPLLVYGATLKLSSTRGDRMVPVEEFFVGPGKTVLESDELLTEISIPDLGEHVGSSFLKLGRVAADIAKINVAVCLKRTGRTVSNCRIAFGSAAPTPIRLPEAEAMLTSQEMTVELITKVAQAAAKMIKPITDKRSTSSYRQQVSKVILEEGIRSAWQRAGGEL